MSNDEMFEQRNSVSGGRRKSSTRVRIEGESDQEVDASVRIREKVEDRLKDRTLKNVSHQEDDGSERKMLNVVIGNTHH
jgi:hypothetical protein